MLGKTLPNIVFVMADDMGYGDPGCYGAQKIKTPSIDRLSYEGMRFTDAHSSSAVCTPSRYSVLTGRYCWRTRLKDNVQCGHGAPLIEKGRPTVASMLKKHGYTTGAFGKWHLGFNYTLKDGGLIPVEKSINGPDSADYMEFDYSAPLTGGPLDCGFDEYFGISGSLDMPPYCFIENEHTVGIPDKPKKTITQQRDGLAVEGWDDNTVDLHFTEKACSFFDKACGAGTPFFAYIPLSSPHRPNVVPDFLEGASEAGPRGDSVMLADHCLGIILDKIDSLGITDNTIVIFTSDNGANPSDFFGRTYGHKSCGDLRGYKADIYEGGHRVPFIMRWPGMVSPSSETDSLCGLIDLYAFAASVVGHDIVESDEAPDSISIMPIVNDHTAETRRTIINHSAWGLYAIRSKEWKMIDGLGSGGFSTPRFHEPARPGETGQLYSFEEDCWEQVNSFLRYTDISTNMKNDLEKVKAGVIRESK